MKPRPIGAGLGVALTLASVSLTLTFPVFAQEEPAVDEPVEAEADDAEAAEEPSADNAEPVDAGAGPEDADSSEDGEEVPEPVAVEPEPIEEEPEPVAKEPVAEEPGLDTPAADAEDDADVADEEDPSGWGAKQLRIVQTPWTAYPSNYIRGLTYGSLWRTFHGQQWPYMPAGEDRDEPAIQIGFSGYVWNDLSHTRISTDEGFQSLGFNTQRRWVTQTRGLLRMTPTYNVGNGWFVQGNGEFVVQGDMRPDPNSGVLATTDDVWVRFGKWDLFDITVGRFQGWEIANHFGMALDWATLERQGAWIVTSPIKPTDGYGLDFYWDRQNFLLGGYALHVYPTKWLRGELLAHIGAGNSGAANPYQFDIRPTAIFDVGFLKIKAGYEFGQATPQDAEKLERSRRNGFGAAAQVVLAPYVEFGGSFARGYTDILDFQGLADLAGSNTVQSFGGFINVSPGHEPLVLGAGAFLKTWEEFRINLDGDRYHNDHLILFGAAQYTLWKQLYLKAVVSYADNKGEDQRFGTYHNKALGGRFRAEFLF